MNWRKVYVLVEGQTEEGFVKNILRQEMPEGLYLQPVIVATKRAFLSTRGDRGKFHETNHSVRFAADSEQLSDAGRDQR